MSTLHTFLDRHLCVEEPDTLVRRCLWLDDTQRVEPAHEADFAASVLAHSDSLGRLWQARGAPAPTVLQRMLRIAPTSGRDELKYPDEDVELDRLSLQSPRPRQPDSPRPKVKPVLDESGSLYLWRAVYDEEVHDYPRLRKSCLPREFVAAPQRVAKLRKRIPAFVPERDPTPGMRLDGHVRFEQLSNDERVVQRWRQRHSKHVSFP